MPYRAAPDLAWNGNFFAFQAALIPQGRKLPSQISIINPEFTPFEQTAGGALVKQRNNAAVPAPKSYPKVVGFYRRSKSSHASFRVDDRRFDFAMVERYSLSVLFFLEDQDLAHPVD